MQPFREVLQTGVPQIGVGMMYPSFGVVERIAPDWDWVWVDGQHGEIDYKDMLAQVAAANLAQRPVIVRVPGHDFGSIGMALDTGADGVVVPLVDNPQVAKEIVKAAKFPPLGGRSYGGRRPIDFRGRTYTDTANYDTLLICQIESPEALENANAIAATPGVDALFLGPDDIMLRRGFKMNAPKNKESLGKDMQTVVSACRKHGKFAVTVAVGPEMIKMTAGMGYNMLVCGADVSFLAMMSKKFADEARDTLKGVPVQAVPKTAETPNSPY